MFKHLLAIVAAAWASAATTQAAAPCPYWTWDGFYFGVNAGVVRGYDKIRLTPKGDWGTTPLFLQDFITDNGTTRLSNWNFIGGVQVGYNYQMCRWLYGIEADANYLNLSDHRNTPPLIAPGVQGLTFVFRDRIEHNWLVTVRPRIGYVIDRFLPYLTGGFAIGDAKAKSSLFDTITGYASFASASKTLPGWTLGGGLEYAFKPFVSVKVEYLYVNLGHFTTKSSTTTPNREGYYEERRYSVRDDIVRIGINYRL